MSDENPTEVQPVERKNLNAQLDRDKVRWWIIVLWITITSFWTI